MGGGLAGCECAIHLGQLGKKVRLIEMKPMLASDANIRHHPLLLREIENNAEVYTSHKVIRIQEDGVVCLNAEQKEVLIPGTSVICALGQRSTTSVVDQLRNAAPFVRVIGDASRVSTITNAVYSGYHAGMDIDV